MGVEELKNVWAGLQSSFHPERTQGIDAEIQMEIEGEGEYYLVIRDQKLSAETGKAPKPRLTLKAKKEDLAAIFEGKLDPSTAFFQGRLNIKGDMSLALQLISFFK
jgi:putative sterol carrier protein